MSQINTNAVDDLAMGEPEEESVVIDLRTEEHRHIILVEGEIDIVNAPRLHERLTAAIESEEDDVSVDLSGVSFIDSTGLGVLVNARQRAKALGATLKLTLPTGQARFPFEVTGLASIFDTPTAGTPRE